MRETAITALALLWGATAQAATVEPKIRLLVREKPVVSARIVDRVPAGKKLPLLGKNADGSWSHVDTGKHEGWVPSAQLKGKAAAAPVRTQEPVRKPEPVRTQEKDDDGEEQVAQQPLAKQRGVRAEAWVSSSRYHDGEDNKLTVSSTKAELFGRPASGGAVVGVVRRGDVVDLVRRSSDRKWCLVDIGGGEVAWIDSTQVRAGAFRAPPADVAPPEPETPPPPPRRARKEVVVADREPVAVEKMAVSVPNNENKVVQRDDEEPPLSADEDRPKSKKDKRKSKKLVKLASRDSSGDGLTAAQERGEQTVVTRPAESTPGNNLFGLGARAGVAIVNQRFTSNGTGALTNYAAGTNAVGAAVGASYTRAAGRYARLGLDASYQFAGAAGVRYHGNDGSTLTLGLQTHTIDFGAQVGLHLNALGGLELRARIGGEVMMDLIQASTQAPLPSDRIVGMTVGAGIAAPNLAQLANRPLGAHLYGWALVPAARAQTVGLEEGARSSTIGASFGGGLAYGLYKGLSLGADYSYGFVLTQYAGEAKRNSSITAAERGNSQHLMTLGLAYNY